MGSPSSSPVPVLQALRGPGGGFNHKQLNATTSGAYKLAERSRFAKRAGHDAIGGREKPRLYFRRFGCIITTFARQCQQ